MLGSLCCLGSGRRWIVLLERGLTLKVKIERRDEASVLLDVKGAEGQEFYNFSRCHALLMKWI